jgi:hypothetical protein
MLKEITVFERAVTREH